MADVQGLNVHDVQISTQPTIGLVGKVSQAVVATYYIGDHGPFSYSTDKTPGYSQRITDAINAEVAELRAVLFPSQM